MSDTHPGNVVHMDRPKSLAVHLTLLTLLSAGLFLYRLGDRDLYFSHEARAAQDAVSVLEDGQWLVPRLFDQRFDLQKPPLFYWVVALIGWLRGGVDAWAVRLPAALAGWGSVLWVCFVLHRLGRPRAGFLAGLMLASAVHFTWVARVGRIDIPLTFTIALALGAFLLALRNLGDLGSDGRVAEDRRRATLPYYFLGYCALAAGVLLKGPIALVLPGVVTASWLFFVPMSARRSLVLNALWGVPFVLAVGGLWFWAGNRQTQGQLGSVFFWYHNIERALGSETLSARPWWFYGPRLLIDFFPASLLLPVMLAMSMRRRAKVYHESTNVRKHETMQRQERVSFSFRAFVLSCFRDPLGSSSALRRESPTQIPFGKLLALWPTAMIVFLSLMSFKRADYLLPAFPGLALSLACWLDACFGSFAFRGRRAALAGCGIFAAVILPWMAYHELQARAEPVHPFAEAAREIRRQTKMPVIFFRVESHLLMFHLGRPVDTILEWENLDLWASREFPVYVVTSAECAAEWSHHLRSGRLDEVMRVDQAAQGKEGRPLVVFRSPGSGELHGNRSSGDPQIPDIPPAVGDNVQPSGS